MIGFFERSSVLGVQLTGQTYFCNIHTIVRILQLYALSYKTDDNEETHKNDTDNSTYDKCFLLDRYLVLAIQVTCFGIYQFNTTVL